MQLVAATEPLSALEKQDRENEVDWGDGYDQGVSEVLSELSPEERRRLCEKFPMWFKACRKLEMDSALKPTEKLLAGRR